MGLAREVIGGCGERAIRSLAQRRLRWMEGEQLVRHRVWRVHAGGAGVVVVIFPGRERAVRGSTALATSITPAGPEVGPGELFFARPDQLDRSSGGTGQARGLNRRLAGMLAAICRAGSRHDHPNRFLGKAERLRQLAAHAEWPLRAGPDCQAAVLPLGHRRARLKRRVGNIGHRVGLRDAAFGCGAPFAERAVLEARGPPKPSGAARQRGVILEVRIQIGRGNTAADRPLGAHGRQRCVSGQAIAATPP